MAEELDLIRQGIIIGKIIVLAVLAMRIKDAAIKRGMREKKKKIHIVFFNACINILITIVAIIAAASQFPMFAAVGRTILAGSGLFFLMVSLLLQQSVENLVGGLQISISKPYDIGDRIQVNTAGMPVITGYVRDINLRSTTIEEAMTSTSVIVPNATMNRGIIKNSYHEQGKCISNPIDVNIDMESDIDLAIDIIKNLIREHELFVDIRTDNEKIDGLDEVQVYIRDIANGVVSLRAYVSTKCIEDNFTAGSDIRRRILKKFKEDKIKVS
jgi:Small-conductance mechanosensitive channel